MNNKKIISYTYKHLWRKRNKDITKLLTPFRGSVLDIGCGDKDILNFFTLKKDIFITEYLGIDRVDTADIVIDLNKEVVPLTKVYDLGLFIGVLEYLDDPIAVLKSYQPFAKRWVILTHYSKKKPKALKRTWHQSYTPEDIIEFKKIFKTVELHKESTSLIWDCK